MRLRELETENENLKDPTGEERRKKAAGMHRMCNITCICVYINTYMLNIVNPHW